MSERLAYFSQMKVLASRVRSDYGLTGPRVMRSDLKRIYKDQAIELDYWDQPLKKLRGAYFDDADGTSVMIAKRLPDDPLIFTMAHELKHHLVDRAVGSVKCSVGNEASLIEIGAEVFAAEFLLPDELFAQELALMEIQKGSCCAETLVHLKHRTKTTLSYAGLTKKAERLGYAGKGVISQGGWRRLEERLYGPPFRRPKKGSTPKKT